METKFTRGQHPDTNAYFWQGFPEKSPPSLNVSWLNQRNQRRRDQTLHLISSIITFGAIFLFSSLRLFIVKLKKHLETKISLT